MINFSSYVRATRECAPSTFIKAPKPFHESSIFEASAPNILKRETQDPSLEIPL